MCESTLNSEEQDLPPALKESCPLEAIMGVGGNSMVETPENVF